VTKNPKWQNSLHDASPFLTVGISLAGAMLFYVGAGYLIDRWLDTSPRYLIVGSAIGMVSFFIQLFRITKLLSAEAKKNHDEKKPPESN
jgi:F0F1-type ATP synthase assembly protein I